MKSGSRGLILCRLLEPVWPLTCPEACSVLRVAAASTCTALTVVMATASPETSSGVLVQGHLPKASLLL